MDRTGTRTVVIAATIAAILLPGCVERRLSITSDPPGALVYFADDEIGRTPLTVPFEFYGDREVILRLTGYQTLETHAWLAPPIYDIPPWDLISQALVPWTFHHQVARHYTLRPLALPTDTELIDRAMELKAENLRETGK